MELFFGLLVLVADIYVIIQTLQSPVEAGQKVLWVIVILLLPLLGLVLWFFLGPRPMRASRFR